MKTLAIAVLLSTFVQSSFALGLFPQTLTDFYNKVCKSGLEALKQRVESGQ